MAGLCPKELDLEESPPTSWALSLSLEATLAPNPFPLPAPEHSKNSGQAEKGPSAEPYSEGQTDRQEPPESKWGEWTESWGHPRALPELPPQRPTLWGGGGRHSTNMGSRSVIEWKATRLKHCPACKSSELEESVTEGPPEHEPGWQEPGRPGQVSCHLGCGRKAGARVLGLGDRQ